MSNSEINILTEEIAALQKTLDEKKTRLHELKNKAFSRTYYNDFSSEEIIRYSRQMIMPQVTVSGQQALKKSKILIVGAGGLGCPASLYLAAAGVGEIHIMDYDEVELSNLHRQILHNETDIGAAKVISASNKLKKINSNTVVVPHHIHATNAIIEDIEKTKYDVVLDCSDNAPTRYLLNDACVLNNVPLVSGSALQLEGQLTVYHYNNGPCYRCLFPKAPSPHTVTNCGDGGVLGAVAGVIGVLQALETVKIVTKMEGVLSGRLLLFDGADAVFRNVKLRRRSSSCDVCGDNPTITSPIDYEQFCGSKAHDKVIDIDVLKSDDNVDVTQLPRLLKENNIILDVRPELEYAMCSLPNTINLPFSNIKTNKGVFELEKTLEKGKDNLNGNNYRCLHEEIYEFLLVYVLCRRGNDSQRTIGLIKDMFPSVKFVNIKGGLHAYSKFIDSSFPIY